MYKKGFLGVVPPPLTSELVTLFESINLLGSSITSFELSFLLQRPHSSIVGITKSVVSDLLSGNKQFYCELYTPTSLDPPSEQYYRMSIDVAVIVASIVHPGIVSVVDESLRRSSVTLSSIIDDKVDSPKAIALRMLRQHISISYLQGVPLHTLIKELCDEVASLQYDFSEGCVESRLVH